MTNTCDLVVIGSGPAGMAAAFAAAEYGLSVTLVDEQPALGGQIYRDVERLQREGRAAAFGPDYASGLTLAERLRGSTVDYRPRTSVWQIDRGFTVFVSHGGQSYPITSRAIVLAVGAIERPVPISDWTLPGVMTVGAAQIMLKTSGLVPPQPFWIAGQGPLPLLYAAQLLKAGIRPAGILDTMPTGAVSRALPHVAGALSNWRYLVKGLGLLATIRRAGVPIIKGVTSLSAEGGDRLKSIKYKTRDDEREVQAEALLLHEGVVPHVHMNLALGVEHRWDEALQAPVPKLGPSGETSLPGIFVAGDAGAIGGAKLAEIQGRKAATGVAHALGQISKIVHDDLLASLAPEEAAHAAIRPFLNAVYTPRRDIHVPPDDVIVCRCEEVRARDIREAVAAGCLGPNQVKSFTRCGMGPCQGRQCALTLRQIIAAARGEPVADIEHLTIRPPLKPLTLGELASLAPEPGASP